MHILNYQDIQLQFFVIDLFYIMFLLCYLSYNIEVKVKKQQYIIQ